LIAPKATDPESHDSCRSAACASITPGRLTALQFVAKIDLLQVLVFQKVIEQNQVEVTCHRKMMLKACLGQTAGQIGSDSVYFSILQKSRSIMVKTLNMRPVLLAGAFKLTKPSNAVWKVRNNPSISGVKPSASYERPSHDLSSLPGRKNPLQLPGVSQHKCLIV
jgi:hypothetical protein